jgi:hypothetical protein
VTPSRTALVAVFSSTVMPQMGSVAMDAGFLFSGHQPTRGFAVHGKKGGGRRSSPAATLHNTIVRHVLLAAAARAAASRLLDLHAGGRALVDAADAGAGLALAPVRLAAAAANTRVATSVLAADGGGHEGQCRQENQTVHGKNPLHRITESITPRHDV